MALDPYAPCPAGTGKKLKFCCSDLLGELEKIQRMIEGNQRLACLEYIESLQSRFPGRACLLTTQAELLMALDRRDEAQRVLDGVLVQAPMNPVALAESALLIMQQGNAPAAVETLQRAIAASPSPMPVVVVEMISALAESLVMAGHLPAALGHLLLVASLLPDDERTMQLILQLNASTQVPLLFKEEPDLRPAPEGVAWRAAFDEAQDPAKRGAWRIAADKLAALAEKVPDAPVIWRNLALLRSWLADAPGAVDALRRLAALDTAADDKVEAEALAQLLDTTAQSARVELLSVTFPVTNVDELVEKLSTRRVVAAEIDPRSWTENNEAPPRYSFALLDRDPPRSGAGLACDDVPNVLGQLFIYGRQTDREARLELSAAEPNMAAARTALDALCGPLLGSAGEVERNGDLPAAQWALSWNWRLPEDTPLADVHRLLVEQRRRSVLTRWTKTSLAALAGKTPEEAARDERLQTRLLAAILILELSFTEPSVGDLFGELRRQLGLPAAAPIDPGVAPVEHLPLARLHRVEWSKADDDTLLNANRRALFAAAHIALRKISLEVVSRDSLKSRIPLAQVYGLLARLDDDSTAALSYLDKARAAAEAVKESTVAWDLQEATMRLERGEPEEFTQILSHIQREHGREPGVAQALAQILVEAGLMTPDGRMVRPPEESGGLVLPGSPAEQGKIWTPESEAGGGKKSALWVPGAE